MEKPVLGDHNPKSLLYTLWYLLTLHFGVRCCQKHHEMFILNKDDQGTEYITFEENPTKTRQGGLRKKRRAIEPKMLSTGGPRCQVSFFKTFPQLPTDLKKCQEIALFISPLLKSRQL